MKFGVLILCMFAVGVAAQEQSPSLGEVAKQKPAKKATRVITNDEIPSRPPEPEVKAGDKAADAAKPQSTDAEKPKDAATKKPAPGDPDLPEAVRQAEFDLGEVRAQHHKAADEVRELQSRIAEATDERVKDALNAQLEDKKQQEAEWKKKQDDAEAKVTAERKAAGLPTGPAS